MYCLKYGGMCTSWHTDGDSGAYDLCMSSEVMCVAHVLAGLVRNMPMNLDLVAKQQKS